jgi:hypothetical protein
VPSLAINQSLAVVKALGLEPLTRGCGHAEPYISVRKLVSWANKASKSIRAKKIRVGGDARTRLAAYFPAAGFEAPLCFRVRKAPAGAGC